MTNISIMVPVLFAVLALFMFYTSGAIMMELLKFKMKNHFATIAAGFFVYFTFISIFTLPLQLISVLPYFFFVYYLWGITIVYLLFCCVFAKYWLSTTFISISSLIYLVVALIFLIMNYVVYKFISDGSFSRHKNTISIMFWLKDNPVSFFNASSMYNVLGFKPFQGWYTFQLSIVMLAGAQSFQYQDVIIPFIFIIDSFVAASIFVYMYDSFRKVENTWAKYTLLFLSLITFVGTKVILQDFNYSLWTGDIFFIYLIMYSIIIILRYTSQGFRERNDPTFVGLVIGGYIAFSWDSAYQVLFLLYGLLFVIQRRYTINFTKDILKMSLFALVDLFFFNIILKFYLQTILFGALLLFLIIVAYLMTRSYSVVIKFETFVDQRINFVTLLLPMAFMIISLGLTLASNESFVNPEDTYLNFLYVWTAVFRNELSRYWITFMLSMAILAISFVWIFIRNRFQTNVLTGIVDLLLISYLTFYNPIVVKFINIIYPMMTQSNGIIMIIQGTLAINVLLYWGFNKINYKKTEKVKVYRKPSILIV
ncbi:hypothetical protein SCHIN_v1c01610 [Spiroplasma chinense]|uniref:Glycosyltransferase RgtA/B/C/D-like domain-containing protein n=1 Tax=Spiroplasma chinense TaxID=216932 RepID=A0A5B9Y3V5_9MOLU|nr:hypothetical protein [Spiroplasma chinense]QEH61359.1 hypothetical protein SCHIN_v1c01610 [Spiroplasma chinense]